MVYSVRMRASQGGPHETGGRHISGAERIVERHRLSEVAAAMVERALSHSRGTADFVNVAIEAIDTAAVKHVPLLPARTVPAAGVKACRAAAVIELINAGVDAAAVNKAFRRLLSLPDSMRGAMLLSAVTGDRLDATGERGVRVSRMDIADAVSYDTVLANRGLEGAHAREAMVLASKVLSAPGMVAELCWSDDPEYTAGYVAAGGQYIRFPHLKPYGSPIGGRVFFVRPGSSIKELQAYLERQPVLVTLAEADHALYQ